MVFTTHYSLDMIPSLCLYRAATLMMLYPKPILHPHPTHHYIFGKCLETRMLYLVGLVNAKSIYVLRAGSSYCGQLLSLLPPPAPLIATLTWGQSTPHPLSMAHHLKTQQLCPVTTRWRTALIWHPIKLAGFVGLRLAGLSQRRHNDDCRLPQQPSWACPTTPY